MKLTEKQLTQILQQPGYSAQVEPKRRQPTPPEVKEIFKYSKHEWRFKCLWESIPGPALEFNYRFDKSRRWRVDWVHLSSLVAIEIEGKGHQFDSRYYGDIFKYNALAEAGYTLIRLTSDMITVQELERIIERIKEKTA